MKVFYHYLGVTDFGAVWKIQDQINKFKQKNHVNDVILTTQHNHVYTLGKSGDKNHLLISDKELRKQNISYYEIDRGGDLTYHGPGQLVCYPIFDLTHYYKDAHHYLRDLEETVILTLKHFSIDSARDSDYTGVWVGDEKICAIGIKLSRWITMHGLALNVNNDLTYFGKIIPCGIFHKGVTRMQNYLKRPIEISEVLKVLLEKFKSVFNIEIKEVSIDYINTFYNVNP